MSRIFSKLILSACAAAPFIASTAMAHISLERGGTHLSRYGDGQTDLKDAPCGHANGPRGTHVYTYRPGQTIDVAVVEYVPHPSYFRIAFDQDGDDGFIDPASIDPIDPNRACPDGPGDHCGAADYYNSPEVLPNMDDLNPHIPVATDLTNPPKYVFHVTLPNVECQNCTLQIIQVMEDDTFHGPYDPTPGVGVADVYHQCIDIVLDANAPVTGEDGGVPTGAGGSAGSSSGQPAASSNDGGGCNIARRAPETGAIAPIGLGLVAFLLRRRRR